MAAHRRNDEDDSPRRHDRDWTVRDEARSWFGDEDSRRRRGNDERDDRYPYGGDRASRYDPSSRGSAGYDDNRSTRWEGSRGDRRYADYGYPGASTGAYRTDDRPYHERYRYRDDPPYDRDEAGRYGGGWSGRFRYPHGTDVDAARDYYRAARDQRDDYMRWSAESEGAEWTDEGRGRDEAPSWGRRERGGYWRQYDRPFARSPYYGRGPKDYQRSDDRVREELCDAMTDDPLLDASEITVAVAHGEVTLSGSVTTRDQKRRAEDVAERISGVRDVTNQLRVAQPSGHGHTATQPVAQASGQGTPSKSSGTSA